MEAITLPVYNSQGKEVETITLDAQVFDGEVNKEVIYQAINAYRANCRTGLAATKTRGEVSGGGRKPWKQKGTGRARVGSTRSPLWRHGGVVFGPHPRDYSYTLPAKIRSAALKASLNAKVKDNSFIVLDSFKVSAPKTKEAAKFFVNLKIQERKKTTALLLLESIDGNVKKAITNIGFLTYNQASDTNAFEVMSSTKIVITKDALEVLTKRLKK